jgi:RimJ/RimL family protein N-acetyltransferase
MEYGEKTFLLKNGMNCTLRSPGPDDASAMLEYLRLTYSETDFMMRYPEEVKFTVQEEADLLTNRLGDSDGLMIAAWIDSRVIGCVSFSRISGVIKIRHRAGLGISVVKEYWNVGLGSLLMSEAIAFAQRSGFEQIELEVITANDRAFRMYRKFGFELYGTRERAFKLKDGSYLSEHLMMKQLYTSGCE